MLDEYYSAGTDHVCLDLGLEKRAIISAVGKAVGKAFGKKLIPRATQALGTAASHAGDAWRAGARARAAAPALSAGATKMQRAGRAVGDAWGATGGKAWNATGGRALRAGGEFLAPAGKAIESGVSKGVGGVLGKPGEQVAANLMKGVPARAARDAAGFAAFGGALEGGMNAYSAEEGQRGKAFLEGAGSGALHGAAMGGLMGGFGRGMKNLRRGSLEQAAKRSLAASKQMSLFPKAEAAALAEKQLNRGFFKSIGDTVKNTGPINRTTSAQNVLGGLGQFSSEWQAPLAVLPASMGGGYALTMGVDPSMFSSAPPQAPQQYPQRPKTAQVQTQPPTLQEDYKAPTRLLGTLAGGAATGIPTGVAFDALKAKGLLQGTHGSGISRVGQALGTAAGALGGYYLGQRYLPDAPTPSGTDPELEQKLDQIDFDKLMRYYKKREADQV